MKEYQKRVVEEKQELDKKKTNLETFVFSQKFMQLSGIEQHLLIKQLRIMKDYSQVLKERINNFEDFKNA